LIPLLLRAINRKDYDFYIYGNDYSTKDKTCIRDYIHVKDICLAHLEILKYISNADVGHHHFNIGSSIGYSVLEIVKKAIEISKANFKIKFRPRRIGDCASTINCNKKITSTLNWQPIYSDLDNIIESSWRWELFLTNKTKSY
jgi:UDP-glucose 4-epimerase